MKKFFVYDPEQGFETFETQEEALTVAQQWVDYYLQDEWAEGVENVVCGEITHQATQTDRKDKPPADEIDEYGYDGDGDYWGQDWQYRCNYKVLSVVQEQNVAEGER